MTKKHLFIGYGRLAKLCAQELVARGDEIIGVSRSAQTPSEGVTFIRGDVRSTDTQRALSKLQVDTVSLILTPDDYSLEGYKSSYLEGVRSLKKIWSEEKTAGRFLFVSSTSVYAQSDGEWVNEDSETHPNRDTAKVLLEAENALHDAFEAATVLRFSGIYGQGRDFLLRQVYKGDPGSHNYTNRIHEVDCAGSLCHVLTMQDETPQKIYLATDSAPVKGSEIRQWLALKMGITLQEDTTTSRTNTRAGNKRCDNSRLLESGYTLRFPSYKDGYPKLIEEFINNKYTP